MPGLFLLLLEAAVNKWRTLPETVVNLTGRTVIVTGSNVGLGFEAAKRFYEMNPARLILAVRNIEKGEEAKKSILEAGTKPSPHGSTRDDTRVDVWPLDLNSFESVKQFANKCEAELERIDILLENAAVVNPAWSVTKDGWESE
jgi:retinol dehydrogenase 12